VWLERDHMLARCEYHSPERDHTFLLDRLASYSVSLLANLAIGRDVVRIVQIEIVDLGSRYELIDLDCMPAFDRYCLEFFLGNFDVLSLADLIAHDDIVVIDLSTRHGIDFAVFDPVSGVFVDLMESDLLALRCCRKELDWTRHQR
jgi:hypothetical protein